MASVMVSLMYLWALLPLLTRGDEKMEDFVSIQPLNLFLEYGGNSNGKPCVFLFIYKSQTFYTCTKEDTAKKGRFWCATTGNYDEAKQWNYCADTSRKTVGIYSRLQLWWLGS
ncbi:hypothetical protein lerEdw1_006552 [Lerista edwardsae]|nr:hypothetical protein lerEdw1_006552 [Lerista edwardsae]